MRARLRRSNGLRGNGSMGKRDEQRASTGTIVVHGCIAFANLGDPADAFRGGVEEGGLLVVIRLVVHRRRAEMSLFWAPFLGRDV